MKKNLIQPETIKKLQTVAKALYEQHGVDVVNYSNFTSLVRQENDKLDKKMSYLTYTDRIAYLSKIIRNLEVDRLKADEKIVAKIKDISVPAPVEPVKELQFIICVYTDGSVERKEPKAKQVEPERELFFGLFDYNDDKVVIRNSKKYNGCDVRSPENIKLYFNSMTWFQTWCQARLDEALLPTFSANTDTPRDIKTLKSIISSLEARKNQKLF